MKPKSVFSLRSMLEVISAARDSGQCYRTLASSGRVNKWDSPPPSSDNQALYSCLNVKGKTATVDKLWREFFSDPSQWWDHRLEKGNARYPDFKHKNTKAALWVKGKFNPQWVKAKLAAMSPGTVQTNIFAWNSKLARYVKAGHYERALELFQRMQHEGMNLDSFTFVSVLSACASLGYLEEGRRIHTHVIERGCLSDVFVGNSLVDMYSKCGSIEDAWTVFNQMPTRDVAIWNAMILGFEKSGQGEKALELFQQMQREGVEPDSITFVGALNACSRVSGLEEGKAVHAQIIRNGCQTNIYVGNSLIDMYVKCGRVDDAWTVFKEMPKHNVVSWNAIILGHVKFGRGQMASELFLQMQQEGVKPDHLTFVAALNACSSLAALEHGKTVHEQIIQSGCAHDVFVGNGLIDMYAKCGSIEDAWAVFHKMSTRTVVTWNAMLGGYAIHGHAKESLSIFERMHQEGVNMDKVTFVSLLSACSNAGLVDEGLYYFESMSSVHGIDPTVEHYASMIGLLGHAGHLGDAEDLIENMTCKPDLTVWMSMLSACRVHGNLELGEHCANRILELNPGDSTGYALLSNMYAAVGNWDRSANIHTERLKSGVKIQPG